MIHWLAATVITATFTDVTGAAADPSTIGFSLLAPDGTVITADRWLSRTSSGISSWLSLASHEYFHVWNGKRMRPVEHGPFEYEHEVYTKSLWIVEGITSYYQHVLLRRAGFYTRDQYLNIVGDLIASIERTPGRLVQALSNASYDAWIKAYRPDENSVNVLFSYYSGGALAALLLDAEIRRVSNGASSLDDVMRAGYHRFSGERGYTEEEFIALVGEVTGHDLSAWIRGVVQTPGRWDYQPMLDWYGLAFETPPAGQVKQLERGPHQQDEHRQRQKRHQGDE
jgi:predicted metalloprotease with PDZ domain